MTMAKHTDIFILWKDAWIKRARLKEGISFPFEELEKIENVEYIISAYEDQQKQAAYFFYRMESEIDETVEGDKRKNKDDNFKGKNNFIRYWMGFFVIQLAVVAFLFNQLGRGESVIQSFAYIEAALLITLVIGSIAISKIIDVNKPQETWSRHTYYQFLRQQEMFRFLLQEGDYRGDDELGVKKFIVNMMKIEERNIEKFSNNMETKEKGMLDELEIPLKMSLPGGKES